MINLFEWIKLVDGNYPIIQILDKMLNFKQINDKKNIKFLKIIVKEYKI